MTVKINDTLCPVRQDESKQFYYVDLDGQATSGATTDELIENLKSRYARVTVYSADAE